MAHKLSISVFKDPGYGGAIHCRKVGIRERMMRFLFGEVRRMTIIIPGDTVEALRISEVPRGGDGDEPN